MAVAYTTTVGGFEYGFDFEDRRIDIDERINRLGVGNLYTAIKEAQASPVGIVYPGIAEASGLDQLSEGISTFITVKLIDWEINTLKVTGKFEVAEGNLIRSDGQDPFRDNPLITYINFISQAGVRATFSTGSGLSAEQDARLMAIPTVTLQADERSHLLAIPTTGGGGGAVIDAQQVRDALKLAPSEGDPAPGSIDYMVKDIHAERIGSASVSADKLEIVYRDEEGSERIKHSLSTDGRTLTRL
jgi:hypothetical protein